MKWRYVIHGAPLLHAHQERFLTQGEGAKVAQNLEMETGQQRPSMSKVIIGIVVWIAYMVLVSVLWTRFDLFGRSTLICLLTGGVYASLAPAPAARCDAKYHFLAVFLATSMPIALRLFDQIALGAYGTISGYVLAFIYLLAALSLLTVLGHVWRPKHGYSSLFRFIFIVVAWYLVGFFGPPLAFGEQLTSNSVFLNDVSSAQWLDAVGPGETFLLTDRNYDDDPSHVVTYVSKLDSPIHYSSSEGSGYVISARCIENTYIYVSKSCTHWPSIEQDKYSARVTVRIYMGDTSGTQIVGEHEWNPVLLAHANVNMVSHDGLVLGLTGFSVYYIGSERPIRLLKGPRSGRVAQFVQWLENPNVGVWYEPDSNKLLFLEVDNRAITMEYELSEASCDFSSLGISPSGEHVAYTLSQDPSALVIESLPDGHSEKVRLARGLYPLSEHTLPVAPSQQANRHTPFPGQATRFCWIDDRRFFYLSWPWCVLRIYDTIDKQCKMLGQRFVPASPACYNPESKKIFWLGSPKVYDQNFLYFEKL
jgi:hypothetical protein